MMKGSGKYLLALDAGTGAGRCLLVDSEGKAVHSAYREWKYLQPADAGLKGYEFDPQYFWKRLSESINEALSSAGIHPEQVIAVSSTSQRVGVVFLDHEGHEVYAGPNRDERASAEGLSLMETYGRQTYEVSGHFVNRFYVPARLRWLEMNRPAVYERIAHSLMINDWVLYRLCGEYASEPTNACETTLFNLYTGDWDVSLIEEMGLPPGIFAPILRSGEVVGHVTPKAARDTGLKAGTPVIVGAADTQCGLLGSGALLPGDMVAVAGSTTPVQMVIDELLIDPQARLWTDAFVQEDTWVLESNCGDTGSILRWMRDIMREMQGDDRMSFTRMEEEAARSPIGAEGVFAFFSTNILNAKDDDPSANGFVFCNPAVTDDPGVWRHLLRAQLESMAYAVRANTEQIHQVSGRTCDRFFACGGSTRSALWLEILANVMDLPIIVSVHREASAMGAAICAGVGAGVYEDLQQGIERLVRMDRTIEPIPALVRRYDQLYKDWMDIRSTMLQIPRQFPSEGVL
jgi:sugar (pentulose or hexulose) kinase